MAFAKKTLFGAKEKKLAALGKALAHPARIQILAALACGKYCNCCRMTEDMPLAQSTVSQHLKILKDLGFIRIKTDGQKSNYTLNLKAFNSALQIMEELLLALKTLKGKEK
jgi:DNA-binding transcriptional ArsR family regulator